MDAGPGAGTPWRSYWRAVAAISILDGPMSFAMPTMVRVGEGSLKYFNGRGVATFYSSTPMPPEVHRSIERASERYVEIAEWQRAVGARLASFAAAGPAMVCSGSAACTAQATAGCIATTGL